MALNPQRSLSLDQIFRSVQNHKLLAGFTFLVLFGLAVAAWLFLPPQYKSEGKLFVQLGRANAGLNPSPDDNNTFSIQDSRETEILSVVQLIQSHDLLEEVVNEIGAEEILATELKLPFEMGEIRKSLFGSDTRGDFDDQEYARLLQVEKAVQRLKEDLVVSAERQTSVISVYCRGRSPKVAQKVVQLLMDKVGKKHVQVHAAGSSKSFFDQQYEQQKAKLVEAEDRLRKFNNQNGFLSVDQSRNTFDAILQKLENEKLDVSVDLAQSRAMIYQLEKDMDSVKRELVMPTVGLQSKSAEEAITQLRMREAERARLLAKYSPNHPKVGEIDLEIAELRKSFDGLPIIRTESEKRQNPVYENVIITLIQQRAKAESLEQRLSVINDKYEEAQIRLRELNQLKNDGAVYARDVEVAKQYLDVCVKKRGEAMVIHELDSRDISDVVVAQPASLTLKKQFPKGSVLLPLGFVFATMSSLLVCMLADRKQLIGPPTHDEIEQSLDLPVLVSIPRVHASRVHN